MFAFIMIPIAALWVADNHAFLANVTDAPWQFVGVHERRAGRQPDGAVAMPLLTDGGGFILFKQMPQGAARRPGGYPSVADGGGKVTASILLPSGSSTKAP